MYRLYKALLSSQVYSRWPGASLQVELVTVPPLNLVDVQSFISSPSHCRLETSRCRLETVRADTNRLTD